MNYSKTVIVGRVGKDPEWREVGNGLCTFGVAVNKSWKDNEGEWQEKTSWFDVSLWGKSGQYMMDKVHKGDTVLVSGEMESRKTDDGKVYWSLTPEFSGVKVLTPKKSAPKAAVVDDDDSLPF